MYGLTGKTVLVTGAAGGIGAAVTRLMGAEGASVIGVDRDEPGLKEITALPAAAGAVRHAIAADLSTEAGTEAAMKEALALAGTVDVFVSCAGILPAWSQEPTEAEWARTMAVNFGSFRWAAALLLPGMRARRGGAVVAVASDLARKRLGPKPYGVSKIAVLWHAMALAAEAGPDGVRVNAVAPGPVDTRMWDGLTRDLAARDGVSPAEAGRRELAGRFNSLGRILQPEEVAHPVAFLASPRASGVNGAVVDLGGTSDHL